MYWLANLFAADDPLYIWVAVVMMAGMFSIMFLVNGIKQWLKKATASRGINKFLTLWACFLLPTILTSIIIYAGIRMNRVMMIPENIEKDNIPLSVSDMMDVNEEFYVKTMTSTRHFPWYNECGCIHPLGLSGPAGSS